MEKTERDELITRIAAVLVERDWVAEDKSRDVTENLVELLEEREAKLRAELGSKEPMPGQPRLCPTCDGAGRIIPWPTS